MINRISPHNSLLLTDSLLINPFVSGFKRSKIALYRLIFIFSRYFSEFSFFIAWLLRFRSRSGDLKVFFCK